MSLSPHSLAHEGQFSPREDGGDGGEGGGDGAARQTILDGEVGADAAVCLKGFGGKGGMSGWTNVCWVLEGTGGLPLQEIEMSV